MLHLQAQVLCQRR